MSSVEKSPDWTIERISPDDAGLEFYLKEYKPFRLTALKQDPDAFGSTYAKEVVYTDADWRGRLSKALAKTFVVVQSREHEHGHERRILAATTLWGPMPNLDVLSNPNLVAEGVKMTETADHETPVMYQLTGVYTRAEARGRGLGQAVVKFAVDSAYSEAKRLGRKCKVGVDVYATNAPAISFYEKCGFMVTGSRPVDADTEAARPELLMHHYDATTEIVS